MQSAARHSALRVRQGILVNLRAHLKTALSRAQFYFREHLREVHTKIKDNAERGKAFSALVNLLAHLKTAHLREHLREDHAKIKDHAECGKAAL